ncbi:MAG: PilZ domain-containing protein [Candidatus Omnitrophica bacterium]|nr:PilZ domain-containing protein [Candidatus Omnitrophota bacterium]
MSEELFDNRRKAKRCTCSLKGVYFTKSKFSEKIECHDISNQGIRISAFEPLRIASYTDIEIDTKRAGTLSLRGKVCWCNKVRDAWHAGIEFNRELRLPLTEMLA